MIGKVIDVGIFEFLIGVNILVKGIFFGIVIDIDGIYEFELKEGIEMLVFFFIGYVN